MVLGVDPTQILQLLGGVQNSVQTSPAPPPAAGGPQDEAADFVSVVLADTEDTWGGLFRAAGSRYDQPTLVLFENYVQSACGMTSSATGPFYCPGDQKLYLDLSFLRELQRMGAGGDFAVAYVIAHEVGHHIQTITGIERQVRAAQQRSRREADRNAIQVRMELQADCYAGVWAHHADNQRDILEAGDIEEAMTAAASIGDDRLQRQAGRRVQPEAFTHGSSKQRVEWFTTGARTGSVEACDTFAGGV